MSTTSIIHRPAPFAVVAGAAVAAVFAVGAVVMSGSDDSGQTIAPSVSHPVTGHHSVFHPTTSGGRVMVGE